MTNVHGKKSLLLLFIMLFACTIGAADYGMQFPQNKTYSGLTDIKSKEILLDEVLVQYQNYKDKYLIQSTETSGGYYILSKATDGSNYIITVSEAHGWGMTIMAYMAGADTTESGEDLAKKYFDGMVKFWNDHRSGNLMNWRVFQGEWSQSSDGAATDGDLDIANAFILGYHQWKDPSYLQYAKAIISEIKQYEMNQSKKIPTIGNFGAAPNATRPSDWLGCNFRNFAAVTGDNFWNQAASAIYSEYSTFVNNHSSATGLVPDFIDNGQICSEWFLNEFQYTNSFNTNACRVPFRFAYDYLLYGASEAQSGLSKMSAWAFKETGGSAANLKSGYWVDDGTLIQEGSELGVNDFNFNSMYFMASFLAGASTVAPLKNFAIDLYNECGKDYSLENADAFGDAIYLLSLLLISGNAWKYGDESTYKKPDPIDTGGVYFEHFNNIYGDSNEQTALGAAFGTAKKSQEKSHQGGCYWYVYGDEFGSTIKNSEGEIVDSTNFNTAVINDTVNKKNYLHMKLKNAKEDQEKSIYPFTGLGAFFRQDIDENDTTKFHTKYVDLSNMKELVIKAKGKGTVKVMLITKAFDDFPDSLQWGHYQKSITLGSNMKEFAIKRDAFEPDDYHEEAKKLKWSEVIKQVKAIHFEYGESDEELEIIIDEIRMTGMEYQRDFGFTWKKPVEVSIVNNSVVSKKSFSLVKNSAQKTMQIKFPVERGSVTVDLFNAQGRMVKSVPLYIENFLSEMSFQELSSGVYFMKAEIDGITMQRKLTL